MAIDAEEVKPEHIPSLDEVNDLTQRKLEAEKDDDKGEEQPKDGDVVSDDPEDDKPGAGEPDKGDEPKPENDKPAPELEEVDTEITKPGKDKVAIKDSDGKVFYFNNLDEVPDGFEPVSYKALMVGVSQLNDKAANDKATEAKRLDDEAAAEVSKRVTKMQEGWDADIKALKLTDKKEINAVYDYMAKELKSGVANDNFKQAYKAMKWDEYQTQTDEAGIDRKKSRGASVQPGGTNPSTKRGMREGPPSGLSLDAVHAKYVSEL